MMEDTESFEKMIAYPCCPKEKVLVTKDSKGIISQRCPNCKKFVIFNFDNMTAHLSHPIRGAAKRLRKSC